MLKMKMKSSRIKSRKSSRNPNIEFCCRLWPMLVGVAKTRVKGPRVRVRGLGARGQMARGSRVRIIENKYILKTSILLKTSL